MEVFSERKASNFFRQSLTFLSELLLDWTLDAFCDKMNVLPRTERGGEKRKSVEREDFGR